MTILQFECMATHNHDELSYLEESLPNNREQELEAVQTQSVWLSSFPVQLPF